MRGSLTIRRARLVLPDRVVLGDLVVEDGLISQLGPELGREVGEVIDADGRLLFPGLVDVRLQTALDVPEVLATTTGVAAVSGVTSAVLWDPQRPLQSADALEAARAELATHSRVHGGVVWSSAPGALPDEATVGRFAYLRAGVGAVPAAAYDSVGSLREVFEAPAWRLWVDAVDAAALAERRALYPEVNDPAEHGRIHVEATRVSR